jgi:hypothetical protein
VFKLYNQQKFDRLLLTVDNQKGVFQKIGGSNHRRLHSCPILLPSEYIECKSTLKLKEEIEVEEEEEPQIFDLELDSIKENKNDLFNKYSILDNINSQQNYYERNLLDKENCHFLIADLAISSIELMKRDEIESDDDPSTSYVQMKNQNNLIIEPVNLKNYHFKLIFDKNQEHSDFDSCSGGGVGVSDGDIIVNQSSQILFNSIEDNSSNELILSFNKTDDDYMSETIDFGVQQQRERRFSWEFDLNDYQFTPESMCKNLFKKYSNDRIPKMSDLKSLLESGAYLDFTKKFIKEKEQLTGSTLTLVQPQQQQQKEKSPSSSAALIVDEKWAPVREQLIITNQKQRLNRTDTIKQQDYRCASCGIKIREYKIKQFRYCEYFSKYFCRCCHSKQQSYIPSYIIFNLDFKNNYLVSNKAKKFLDKIYYEPLITLEDLNPTLFETSSNLFSKIKQLRLKLVDCKRYIASCRLAIELKKYLEENFSDYLYTDTRVYSIDSLYKFKKSKLYDQMKFILNKITQHILACEICSQQGFLCELCKNSKLIYPFDIDNVIKCPNCLTCYHKVCLKQSDDCLKCKRKKSRTNTPTLVLT